MFSNELDVPWSRHRTLDLRRLKRSGQHVYGEFSMAVVPANNLLEDQSQIESGPLSSLEFGPYGTFVGVYDGHGGPDTSLYVNDQIFKHLKNPQPILSSEPSITVQPLQPQDQFLVFASDGLWEHLSNQGAVNIVQKNSHSGSARRLIKAALQEAAKKREMRYSDLKKIDRGVRRHFHDDITVIIVFLDSNLVSRANSLRGPSLSTNLHDLAVDCINREELQQIMHQQWTSSTRAFTLNNNPYQGSLASFFDPLGLQNVPQQGLSR
ncbi:hypothetical protein OPV22_014682 [Ensete ventricosum]|uniref:protein-serine/threonine phosphatase n=1 Tax=Ensete ventricosum TaxID=4639 RepID=A0AAV8RCF7_ENSVE|nr:hypothetical protein OPV22_014682 [Ensete ventricosum]